MGFQESSQMLEETQSSRIHSLNNLRGIACAIVVFSHMFLLFWINNTGISGIAHVNSVFDPSRDRLPLWSPIFDLVRFLKIDLGNYGVGIFFLVSGYLIPISLEKLSRKKFIISRFFRIFPVFWLSLLALVLAQFIYSYSTGNIFYLTIKDFLANFFMFRDLAWVSFIENATWTLEVELKFYIICALILYKTSAISLKRVWLFSFSVLLLFCIPLPDPESMYSRMPEIYKLTYTAHSQLIFIPFMFIGVLCYHFDRGKMNINKLIIGSCVLIAIFLVASIKNINPAVRLESFPISYLLALFTFLPGHFIFRKKKAPRFFSALADISYPLYLIHGTFGYVLMTALYPIIKIPELVSLTCLAVTVSLASLIHKYVEKKGIIFGKKLTQQGSRNR